MRVVWITHNYPRYSGDMAGAFLHPLAVALRDSGVDVRVVAPSDRGTVGERTLDGVPVERVRYAAARDEVLAYQGTMASAVSSPRGLASLLRLEMALRRGAARALAGETNALIHAHWWIPGGAAAPRTHPMILTSHGTDVRLLERFSLARRVARPVYRRAKVVTVVSQALADAVQRTVGIAVPPDRVQPMPLALTSRPPSDRVGGIVVIARLTAQKRVGLAIDALAKLKLAGREITLTVVGDGPEHETLARAAKREGLEQLVTFAGAVPPQRVAEFLAHARCCIVPSRDEGFGLVAVEALMQGVPVVACTDGGGLLDVVPRSGAGRVVDPDPDAIALAVAQLLDDSTSADNAMRQGEHWQQQIDPNRVAKRFVGWYETALGA